MKSIKSAMKILGLTAMALTISSTAFAKWDSKNHMPPTAEQMQKHMDKRMEHLFKIVDATDTQKAQIKTIFDANKGTRESEMKQMQDIHAQMKALRAAHVASDSEQAKALRAKMNAQREEMIANRAQTQRQIKEVLTPEQMAKLKAHRAEHKHHMHNKMGKMNHGDNMDSMNGDQHAPM